MRKSARPPRRILARRRSRAPRRGCPRHAALAKGGGACEWHGMTDARTLLALCGALYGAGLGLSLFGLRRDSLALRRAGATLLRVGFVAQSAGLYVRGLERAELPVANAFEMLQVLSWGVVAVDILLRLASRVRLPESPVCGLAALLSVSAFLRPGWDGAASGAFAGNPWVGFHVASAVLAFSLFAALALNSLAYLVQHAALTGRRPGIVSAVLPPLRQLDRVGTQLLGVGLGVFSLSLAIGFATFSDNGSRAFALKLVLGVLVWLGYVAVSLLRRNEKLGARGFARACVALFLLALVSLWPANAVRSRVPANSAPGDVLEVRP